MRISSRLIALVFGAALIPGCGGGTASSQASPSEAGPHGGVLVAVPENQCAVEVLTESRGKTARKGADSVILAYFLKPDGGSVVDPPPTDVKISLEIAGKAAEVIPLTLTPEGDDPLRAGRFASQPGPFRLSGSTGEVRFTSGGQSRSIAFDGGRARD